jgi:HisJ family histidinol phosphate phosphatase
LNGNVERDPRLFAIPDTHGHCKGEHKPYAEERPLPLTARMLFLWFYHACRRGHPRFLMVADHMNYLTFEDPASVNLVRRALKLAQAGDLYGAAETAGVEVTHAAVVSEGLRRGMRFSIGAEVDNDPRSRPDAQNIVDAMRPDAMIRSVHFLPITHPVHGENWSWPFDNPEFKDLFEVVGTERTWELYVTMLVDAIERLPGHIVGHFYVPAVFGNWPDDHKLQGYEDRMLAAAGERGMAVEFNTRFLYRDHPEEEKQHYLNVNARLLRKAKERGVGIAIGSDAHSPRDQGGAFDIVLQVLDDLEINEIVFPLAGVLRRVALRVVREPEPEPVAVVVEAEPVPPAPEPTPAKPPRAAPARKPKPAPSTAAAETAKPPTAAHAAAPPVAAPPAPPRPKPAPAAAKPAPAPAKPAPAPVPAKAAAPKPPVKAAAAKPSAAKPVAAKPVAKAAPAARPAKPAKPAKPAAKAAPKRAAAKPKPPAKPARGKTAKPAPKAAAKRTAAKPAAKRPAAKPAAKRSPAKPARPAPKRAAAPKKRTTKKSAPARGVAARKGAAAKKTTGKKTAPKRR